MHHPLKDYVITIDGPSASGKGTLAKRLSEHYLGKYLDTGAIYRALTWYVLNQGERVTDIPTVIRLAAQMPFDFRHIGNNQFATFMGGESIERLIRTPEIDHAVTTVATNTDVRQALLNVQKAFVEEWAPQYGVILDGRDTGARIAPEAMVKFFVVADATVRAERRVKELESRGLSVSAVYIETDMRRRDERDAANTIQTEDALVLDATKQTPDEMKAQAVAAIDLRLGGK